MIVNYTARFKKDYKAMKKRGSDMEKINEVIRRLAIPERLEPRYRNHVLIGEYKGHSECHIEPDWLLIYYYTNTHIICVATGSHSDLFE